MNYKHRIAYIGQKKNEEHRKSLEKLINVRGMKNYTKEVCDALNELFIDGKIESHPALDGYGVEWKDKYDNLHRHGLPAMERKDYIEYDANGRNHRLDGPARIRIDGTGPNDQSFIQWFKDGQMIAGLDAHAGAEVYNSYKTSIKITAKQYAELVKANFPEVGDKIWHKDYAGEIIQ